MSCDFKPGDEVVCVDAVPRLMPGCLPTDDVLQHGAVYTVTEAWVCPTRNNIIVSLAEVKNGYPYCGHSDSGFYASRFRKVQRRSGCLSLEDFFTVPGGFEEPKRAPAKHKEKSNA